MELKIESQSITWIEVYKCHYQLDRNNSGAVVCRDCKKEIAAGLGIHRRAYKRNGYLCFACFSKDVTILTTRYDGGDAGFFIDSLGRLRACSLSSPMFLSCEILRFVYDALLAQSYTSIDILIGGDFPPQVIEDLASSLLGA